MALPPQRRFADGGVGRAPVARGGAAVGGGLELPVPFSPRLAPPSAGVQVAPAPTPESVSLPIRAWQEAP